MKVGKITLTREPVDLDFDQVILLRDGARFAAILEAVLVIVISVNADAGTFRRANLLVIQNRPLAESLVDRFVCWGLNTLNPLRSIDCEVRLVSRGLGAFPGRRFRCAMTTYSYSVSEASLTPSSFRVNDIPPTVTVAAACSKHRLKDVLPLHAELVSQLRVWLGELKRGQKLLPLLGGRNSRK
jgi:hypothetical protein